MTYASSPGSTSSPCNVTCFSVTSSVVNAKFIATGTSLTGAMLMMTVATVESATPSFTLKVKDAWPLMLGAGV